MAELMRFIGAVSGLMMVGYTMAMLLGYRLYQAGISLWVLPAGD